jgi:hypothetical protein
MPASDQWSAALWGIGLGVLFLVAVWLVVSNAWFRKATADRIPQSDIRPDPIGTVEEYPEGLGEAHGRVTLFLKAYIVLFVIWTVLYVANFLLGGRLL